MDHLDVKNKIWSNEYREYTESDAKGSAGILRPQLLEGTLYPLLNRLKNAEILTYRWVESSSGPPRKYFRLTEKGEAFHALLATTWSELATGVELVTRKTNEESNTNNNI
jgi:PadR family transcriptional regulator PadR